MTTASGWAVIERGQINVRTVSPERRGAIVNFLHAFRRIFIDDRMDDIMIEKIWREHRQNAEVRQVSISTRNTEP